MERASEEIHSNQPIDERLVEVSSCFYWRCCFCRFRALISCPSKTSRYFEALIFYFISSSILRPRFLSAYSHCLNGYALLDFTDKHRVSSFCVDSFLKRFRESNRLFIVLLFSINLSSFYAYVLFESRFSGRGPRRIRALLVSFPSPCPRSSQSSSNPSISHVPLAFSQQVCQNFHFSPCGLC